jgi:hypothetical protein
MPTPKEIAQFFRLALRFRLVDTAEVDRWVDSIVAAEPTVRFPFTDLAGASQLRAETIDQLLGQVTGAGDDYLPGRMMLALLRRRLRDGSLTPEAAIRFALEAGRAGAVTEAECYKADHLDDSVWLATNDTYGTLGAVRRDIVVFFQRYAEYDEQIPTAT